jgi:hypothetical protein
VVVEARNADWFPLAPSSHSLISLMGENERLSSSLSIQVVFNQSSRPSRKTPSTDVAEWFRHSRCRRQVQLSLCPLDVSRYNVVRCAVVGVFDLNHRHEVRSECCAQIHDSRLRSIAAESDENGWRRAGRRSDLGVE